jgi:hypothetical protein
MHLRGISYDLDKAVYCGNHELLLSKLNWYGIQNIAGQWFKQYLHYRKQTSINKYTDSNNSIYSEWGVIKHTLPQYSHLVLCFSLYKSMICPQSPTLNLNLSSLLVILILLFHMKKLTVFKIA